MLALMVKAPKPVSEVMFGTEYVCSEQISREALEQTQHYPKTKACDYRSADQHQRPETERHDHLLLDPDRGRPRRPDAGEALLASSRPRSCQDRRPMPWRSAA